MKWFDETAYDGTTGEGTIAFLEAELNCLQPGDEVLHNYAGKGFWAPITVECVEEGNIYILNGNDLELVRANLARTTRLPKGFLIHPTYELQRYAAQLLAREQANGNVHPPPSAHTSDYRKFFLVYVVILLHGEFAGQDVPHRSLKHRAVNDLLSALPMECLALHEHSEESTKDGMWVKDIERNIGDLRHIKGQLKKFQGYGKLADVVPRKTIRWVGSEEAYQAILDEFRVFRARIPEFKSYSNNGNRPIIHEEQLLPSPSSSQKLKMSEGLEKQIEDFLEESRQNQKEAAEREERYQRAIGELKEQHRKEMDELRKERGFAKGAAVVNPVSSPEPPPSPPPPPDKSGEFLEDIKVFLQGHTDVNFTTEEIRDCFQEEWEPQSASLGELYRNEKGDPRGFLEIVRAALNKLWREGEIQYGEFRYPFPNSRKSRQSDWRWSVLANPLWSLSSEQRLKRQQQQNRRADES